MVLVGRHRPCDMKSIIQSEAAECGLVSLAMIAGAHGMRLSLIELRSRFQLSLKGAQLNHLIHIAQQMGFPHGRCG